MSKNLDIDRIAEAAPDLLTACKAMQQVFWMVGSGVHIAGTFLPQIKAIDKQAKAAIKKATNG